jgi:hypothetical protein
MITNIKFWGSNELSNGGMRISWSDQKLGYGNIDVFNSLEGHIQADTEYMGKEFLTKVLLNLVEKMKIDS